jgi:tRNA G18 (ribose-2'-O)-methylase SpoU
MSQHPEPPLNIHSLYKEPLPLSMLDIIARCSKLPYSLLIYNCHGDFNIGTLIRTANCLGASKVWTVGRRKFDRRTLVGCQNYTDLERLDEIPDLVSWFQERNMYPIFIEQNGYDMDTFNFGQLWEAQALQPCLVVGSECDGIPESFMAAFPNSPRLTIGQPGLIRSLNVGCAGSIAMEHMYGSWKKNVVDRYGLI